MQIESTINISASNLQKLNLTSNKTRLKVTRLIGILMQTFMRDSQLKIRAYCRIKYQPRDDRADWRRLHISMDEGEYERYLDMRKTMKYSISFILAIAIEEYLEKIVAMLLRKKIPDNYTNNNYIFIKKIIDGIICWQFYWGIPNELAIEQRVNRR